MADRWLDDFIEKELNKPTVLTRLKDAGFELYGNHSKKGNEVYKCGNEIVIYYPLKDKILTSWNINDTHYDIENG